MVAKLVFGMILKLVLVVIFLILYNIYEAMILKKLVNIWDLVLEWIKLVIYVVI